MNMNEVKGYEAPCVEIVEVEVEKGFATSGQGGTTYDGETPGWNNGSN